MKKNSRLSKNDILFTLLMLLITSALGYAIYWHSNQRIGHSGGDPVGTVTYKQHVVLRKYSDRFVWEEVDPKTDVFLFDSVITKDLSDATISLNNGFKLDLDANSMVVIDFIDDQLGIKIEKGVVHTAEDSEGGVIASTDGTIVDMKDAKGTIAAGDGGLQVSVKEGEAVLNKDGQEQEINEGENAVINKDGIKKIETAITIEYPENRKVIATSSTSENLNLQWDTQKPIINYTIKVADNGLFQDSRSSATSAKQASVSLGPGIWYWQVSGKDKDGKEYISQPGVFTVIQENPLRPHGPLQGDKIAVNKDKKTSITFKWSKPDTDTPVKFQLAADPQFKNIMKEQVTVNNSLVIEDIGKGEYYWSVEKYYGNREVESRSSNKAVVGFSVVDGNEETTDYSRISVLTQDNLITNHVAIDQKETAIKWQKADNTKGYTARFSRDRAGNTNAVTSATDTTTIYPPVDLSNGAWYWSVKNTGAGDDNYTSPRKLTIKGKDDFDDFGVSSGDATTRNFRWESMGENVEYVLDIATDRGMNKKVKTYKTRRTYATIDSLPSGTLYYTITASSSKSGKLIAKTATDTFKVKQTETEVDKTETPAQVSGLSPAGKIYLSEGGQDEIKFKWSINGAEYYIFKIFDITGGKNKQLIRKETTKDSLTMNKASALSGRTIRWMVYAANGKGEAKKVSQPAVSTISIESLGPVAPPKITSVKVKE